MARKLAAAGVKTAISARSRDKLDAVAQSQPGIVPVPLDVTDIAATRAAYITVEQQLGPLDLAVLNAGTWDPMGAKDFDAARAKTSMAVNYEGIANGLEVLIPAMRMRGSGHIAVVSSSAGYRGLPKAAAYAPSKAAVISLAEVLKPELDRLGIDFSLVNPGFVETPMTEVNTFPMPFKITADDAANRILRGLDRKRFEIAFPWQLITVLKVLRLLPYRLYFPIVGRMLPRTR